MGVSIKPSSILASSMLAFSSIYFFSSAVDAAVSFDLFAHEARFPHDNHLVKRGTINTEISSDVRINLESSTSATM